MGEPFVNKNFFEMIKICDDYGVFVETITNGSLLNDKIIDQIINSKSIYRVSVSIDGASKEVFEKIRVKSNFENVIKNIKNLSKKNISNKNKLSLRAMVLLQKSNYHQLEEIVKLCKEVGFHELEVQVQLTGWGKDEWENKNRDSDIHFDFNKKSNIQLILDKYNSNIFKTKIVEENILSKDNKCSYPWHNPYVSANGSIVSCCMVADPKVNNYGNINKEGFNHIWNSRDYQDLRKSINNHTLKDFCKNCYKENRE
jgi:pyrroloquinoline quinone biosynthesis protein E